MHGLIQAARRGILDRSALLQVTPKSTSAIELKACLHELAANSHGLDKLFKQAGIPLEEHSALKRTTCVQEFKLCAKRSIPPLNKSVGNSIKD